MSEQENIKQLNMDVQKKWKAPLDVRIFAWFFIVVGIIAFLLGILLITGIAYTPPGYQKKVLGGIIVLKSDTANAIYTLILGALNFINGYILIKGKKIGWWLAFVGSIYGISDSILLGFAGHNISASIGILMSLVIIIWLFWRRRLYGIGEKIETKS
jgi:hypothetical protein